MKDQLDRSGETTGRAPENGSGELPTRRRMVIMDDSVQKRFRQFATSTGLTNNLALHALLNCFDAYGDPDSALRCIETYRPGPTKKRSLIADDATFERLRGLAATFRVTSNVALAVLLECYRAHPGPIRVEGAGLRVPCPFGSPCAPAAPSAGPAAVKHVAPTRLRDGMSIGPVPAAEAPGPDNGKAALLQALIAEEESKARIYRKSAALLSALIPDA